MTLEDLIIERISFHMGSQLALQVAPTTRCHHFQYVYRAGKSVYWNADTLSFEDQFARETSPLASFQRMAHALEGELGLRFTPSPTIMWDGVPIETQVAIQNVWL